MEQLVGLVKEKTGISDEQARQAVETVITYLKGQLPAPIASQLDGVLSGNMSGLGSMTDQAQGALGGLFGKK
jgi:hypothetical protein